MVSYKYVKTKLVNAAHYEPYFPRRFFFKSDLTYFNNYDVSESMKVNRPGLYRIPIIILKCIKNTVIECATFYTMSVHLIRHDRPTLSTILDRKPIPSNTVT